VLYKSDDCPRDGDRLVLEGNPPEASLPARSEFGLLRPSTAVNVFVAYLLHRLRRNADQLPRPSGGRLKFALTGPTLIVFEGVPLCAVAMIPHEVDRVRSKRRASFPTSCP
jgi:hypothetical protein